MIVGLLEITFQIPESASLKEKRKVVRSLKDRIRNRFNVSLAETQGQETWQTCTLAFAMVATSRAAIERDLERIAEIIEEEPAVAHADHWIDFL